MAEKEYIEREKIKFHRPGFEERCHNDVWAECVDIAYKSEIDSIPAADVVPVVRGKWYWDKDGMDWGIGSWRCSECHARPETWWQGDSTNPRNKSGHYFCPNCGAKMEESDG